MTLQDPERPHGDHPPPQEVNPGLRVGRYAASDTHITRRCTETPEWVYGNAGMRNSKASSHTPTPAARAHLHPVRGRLAEIGARPSIGSIADSYDTLAETTNGLYKTELIFGPQQGPWRNVEEVELATMGWVHWFNNDRIHGYLDNVSPAAFEAAYAAHNPDQTPVGNQ